jgi:peptidoglycan/xylan/chitin deacetylase (PgdA/CDA1 family)
VRTAAVLLYHRIERVERDPLGLAVAPAHFAEHLGVLAGRTVPLAELAAGDAPAGSVALTFDDGYADNLREALPALAAAGVPATLFVATGAVEAGAGFWWDTVDRLLLAAARGSGPLTVTLGGDTRAWPARSAAERDQARGHLHAWLQARPPEQIGDVLAQLGTWAGADPTATPDRDRPLTVAELRQLAAAGPFAVGAHTRSHRSLAPSPRAVQREELAGSGDDLARWLGALPEAVSYPFGVPGVDVDATTVAVARELGYRVGVVNAPGRIGPATPRLALPRLTAPDVPGGAFAAWLDEQLRA